MTSFLRSFLGGSVLAGTILVCGPSFAGDKLGSRIASFPGVNRPTANPVRPANPPVARSAADLSGRLGKALSQPSAKNVPVPPVTLPPAPIVPKLPQANPKPSSGQEPPLGAIPAKRLPWIVDGRLGGSSAQVPLPKIPTLPGPGGQGGSGGNTPSGGSSGGSAPSGSTTGGGAGSAGSSTGSAGSHKPCVPIVIGCGPFVGLGRWGQAGLPIPCGPVVVSPPDVVVVTVPQPSTPAPSDPPASAGGAAPSAPSPSMPATPPSSPAPAAPEAADTVPTRPLPAPEGLLRVPVGATLTLQSGNLGPNKGRLLLLVDKLVLDATIDAWSQDQATATLPAVGIAEPLSALLVLVRADGQPVSSVQVELLPADWQAPSAGQLAAVPGH